MSYEIRMKIDKNSMFSQKFSKNKYLSNSNTSFEYVNLTCKRRANWYNFKRTLIIVNGFNLTCFVGFWKIQKFPKTQNFPKKKRWCWHVKLTVLLVFHWFFVQSTGQDLTFETHVLAFISDKNWGFCDVLKNQKFQQFSKKNLKIWIFFTLEINNLN